MQHFLLALILIFGLAGCARAAVPPAPTALPNPTAVILHQSGEPVAGLQTISGVLLGDSTGAAVYSTVVAVSGEIVPARAAPAVWIGAIAQSEANPSAAADQVVQVRGLLEGPGSFGPGGMYRYQMQDAAIVPLSARTLTMPLLLQNVALYEEQLVQLQGELLLSSSSAILSERSGSGGVPADNALQIKLAPFPPEPMLSDNLRTGLGEDVRYGSVTVSGIWRDNRLYPLMITIP